MKQNKTYLHLGVTLIVSACAVLMFYDTFFQSRVLLDFFDKLMQVLSPVIYGLAFAYLLAPIVDFFDRLIEKAALVADRPWSPRQAMPWLTSIM